MSMMPFEYVIDAGNPEIPPVTPPEAPPEQPPEVPGAPTPESTPAPPPEMPPGAPPEVPTEVPPETRASAVSLLTTFSHDTPGVAHGFYFKICTEFNQVKSLMV